jgi:hypothetical protein
MSINSQSSQSCLGHLPMTLSKPFVVKMCVIVINFYVDIFSCIPLRLSDFAVRAEPTKERTGAFQPKAPYD